MSLFECLRVAREVPYSSSDVAYHVTEPGIITGHLSNKWILGGLSLAGCIGAILLICRYNSNDEGDVLESENDTGDDTINAPSAVSMAKDVSGSATSMAKAVSSSASATDFGTISSASNSTPNTISNDVSTCHSKSTDRKLEETKVSNETIDSVQLKVSLKDPIARIDEGKCAILKKELEGVGYHCEALLGGWVLITGSRSLSGVLEARKDIIIVKRDM